MWITKLKLMHKDCPIVTRCKRFRLVVFSYPSTWYVERGKKFSTTTCYFQSSDESKKNAFIEDLRADKRITHLEISGNIFSYEIDLGKKGEHVMLYYARQIIFVKPVVNHYDGHEYWEVASWKREVLEQFIDELKTHMDACVILKIENVPLTDVYFPNVLPKLSKGQQEAIELAYNEGYYSYPRKVSLEDLARISQVGVSTFQEHLRKAEVKLLPVIMSYQIHRRQ
jgi:predicted DNA binding protein